jgi:hypothetical protein
MEKTLCKEIPQVRLAQQESTGDEGNISIAERINQQLPLKNGIEENVKLSRSDRSGSCTNT